MAYNHGKEERKWRLWKEKEERIMRECGVDESVIEEIRIYDREEFNSDRRFYTHMNETGEYLDTGAGREQYMEINTVVDLLNAIDDRNLYQALCALDKSFLDIVLLKMQGYSTREIAMVMDMTESAIYNRLDRLRKKLKCFKKGRK